MAVSSDSSTTGQKWSFSGCTRPGVASYCIRSFMSRLIGWVEGGLLSLAVPAPRSDRRRFCRLRRFIFDSDR